PPLCQTIPLSLLSLACPHTHFTLYPMSSPLNTLSLLLLLTLSRIGSRLSPSLSLSLPLPLYLHISLTSALPPFHSASPSPSPSLSEARLIHIPLQRGNRDDTQQIIHLQTQDTNRASPSKPPLHTHTHTHTQNRHK